MVCLRPCSPLRLFGKLVRRELERGRGCSRPDSTGDFCDSAIACLNTLTQASAHTVLGACRAGSCGGGCGSGARSARRVILFYLSSTTVGAFCKLFPAA